MQTLIAVALVAASPVLLPVAVGLILLTLFLQLIWPDEELG